MKLSAFREVDATVQRDGSSPIAEAIVSRWAYDEHSIRWFRSSANFVYWFRQGGEKRFLRFIHATDREKEQIAEEVRLLLWLAESGLSVAKPIQSNTGSFVETVETEAGVFHAVVFAALKGGQYEIEDLTAPQYRTWGAALGKLHALTSTYQPGASRRKSWKDHLDFVRQYIADDEEVVGDEWSQISNWASSLPVDDKNFGLIHFDFELDNLCWTDDTVELLDFDDCSYYWYAADIAFALRDLFNDGVDVDNPSFKAFVDGYREQFPLDQGLLAELPMFLRMHNLVMYGKYICTMDVPADQLPEWLLPLHHKLSSRATSYRMSLMQHSL